MKEEKWEEIQGYNGWYSVSSKGRVKSNKRISYKRRKEGLKKYHYEEKILKQVYNKKNGYMSITLRENNKPKTEYVHRLVLTAFKGESKLHTHHRNNIKTDNRLENLEWVTRRKNTRKMFEDQKCINYVGIKKIYNKKNISYAIRMNFNKKRYFLGQYRCLFCAKILREICIEKGEEFVKRLKENKNHFFVDKLREEFKKEMKCL